MSEYRDYEISATHKGNGEIVLVQGGTDPDHGDVIYLTPDQLVRLGEWAKSWAKREGSNGG